MLSLEQRGESPEDHRPRTYGGVEQQSGYAVASVPLGDQPEHGEPGDDGNYENYDRFQLSPEGDYRAVSRFLSLIEAGVTSTSSSSLMKDKQSSRVMTVGGVRITASSEPAALTLVSFLPLAGFTTRSPARQFSPMICPP